MTLKIAAYLAGIACAALTAGLSVPASAATLFVGSIDHVDLHAAGDGLLVYANPLANSHFSFSLDSSNPTKVINNFLQIGTTEGSVELFEDTVPQAIKVFFNFDNPFDSSAGAVSGSTTGFYTFSLDGPCGAFSGGCGAVNFDPVTFTFGANNSGAFTLDLSDATFATPGSANVSATFKLLREAAPSVPEPATWAMMLVGFGLIGGTMRRRVQPKMRVNFA